ncbi:MAG: DNA repair protein RecO [Pseudohongiellaceae bacterium]
MDTRVTLQPAYVLHRRPFQNSSLLIDLFTYDYGRVKAIAKGARREKSRYRSFLQLFQPLLVSFSGRGEIKTVGAVETGMAPITLQGERLFSGLYINELLIRLLHNQEEHTPLYRDYQQTLLELQGTAALETVLRRFEMTLLGELGYGLNLNEECFSHRPIEAGLSYRFTPDVGFEQAPKDDNGERIFLGRHLIALKDMTLQENEAAAAAKRLLRQALGVHLGDKPLASRSLFTSRNS